MTDERVIFLVGLVSGGPTPADRSYVVEYDPMRPGTDGWNCHLRWTRDRDEALRFENAGDAFEYWKRGTGRTRLDGKPDRPLTAFTVEIISPDDEPFMKDGAP